MFFFTLSFNLIIPEMNSIISDLGGGHLKGWIIGLFTISAGISRPFSGKMADYLGRKITMLLGIVVAVLVTLSYPFAESVWFLLMLRFFHGFCQGFFPTGATALVTDILPENHRGFGMGLWGTFISLGIGTGQVLSTYVVDLFGKNGLFWVATSAIVLAYLFFFQVNETLQTKHKFSFKSLLIRKNEWFEKNVIPVAVVMFLSALCSGIIFVLTPDMSELFHIHSKGIFFLFYVLATILVRLFTGKLSDLYGRRQVLLVGMSLLAISMYSIGHAGNGFEYILASVVFGIATGINSPTIFAWTADLSPENRRGIGAGTMFIALEFGILAGSVLTNFTYENNPKNIPFIFNLGAASALITLIYLSWHLAFRKSPH